MSNKPPDPPKEPRDPRGPGTGPRDNRPPTRGSADLVHKLHAVIVDPIDTPVQRFRRAEARALLLRVV